MKINIIKKLTSCLLFLTLLSACAITKSGNAFIQQGVSGQVVWTEGNQMPGIGSQSGRSSKPVARTIKIYELTRNSDVTGASPLFSQVKSKLIATVKTNDKGMFSCELAPGMYSIFTVEQEKLFASLGDGAGNIAPVEVKANEVTKYDININYSAAY